MNFKNKKITIMGLGLLGRGVNVAKFLAKHGAKLTITDLKTKDQLSSSIKKLEKFYKKGQIKYVLGKHNLSDFKNKDIVIKAAGVPLNSPYIKEAKKNKIPIEMDASFFAKLSPATIVGITGTKGKSTVTALIYEILKSDKKNKRKIFLGGNVKGIATMTLLDEAKEGDVVVLELDSWQLQGFGDAKISPHIAVFTSFMRDHMNYYKNNMRRYFLDKANIFKYQKKGDFLIIGDDLIGGFKKESVGTEFDKIKKKLPSKIVIAKKKKIKTNLVGEHNLRNIALAIEACKRLGAKEEIIKKTIAKFSGIEGRMEFVRKVNGVKYYNDTTATMPDAVVASLEALGSLKNKKIILIGGGADKNLVYKGDYIKTIKKYVKVLILFKGAASDKISFGLGIRNKELGIKNRELSKNHYSLFTIPNSSVKIISEVASMKEAINEARKIAKKGDIILLSPGAASFGVFRNEFDRGDQFCREVKKLKNEK